MDMNDNQIRDVLVERGRKLFEAKKTFVNFTGDNDADKLLNDLKNFPHAFVLACVMDRQVKAELAWLIPYKFQEKLRDFSFLTLANLSQDEIRKLMTEPQALHRFPEEMSNNFYQAVRIIKSQYNQDASMIWRDKPSSAEVVYRFLQFRGVGPKIATMAANILSRDFKIEFSDYYSIDISIDVHVQRVFVRLGLVNDGATVEEIIYRARSLYPEFPGLMDLPTWEIGRNWCKPKQPNCKDCYMKDLCQYN